MQFAGYPLLWSSLALLPVALISVDHRRILILTNLVDTDLGDGSLTSDR